MTDTLGGGLQVRTGLDSCSRRLKTADSVEVDSIIRFAQAVLCDPLSDTEEKLKASELLRKIHDGGHSIALKLMENERLDAGATTGREEIVVKIEFDDAG